MSRYQIILLSVIGALFFSLASFLSFQFEQKNLHISHIWISFLIAFGIIFWVYRVMNRRIRKQIQGMTRVARRYAKGKLDEKVAVHLSDEWYQLGRSLNKMALALKGYIQGINDEKMKLEAILENMQEGVIAIDQHKQILMVNSSFEKTMKIQGEQAMAHTVLEVLKNAEIDDITIEALRSRDIVSGEVEIQLEHPKIFKINAIGMTEPAGDVAGVLVFHDISKLRQLQKMRQEFVANVSHELKTPLTSIKGFVETLLSGAVDDKQKSREFLEIIQKDANRLSRLIEGLLELSKLDTKKLSLQIEELNINEEMDSVVSLLEAAIQERNLKIDRAYSQDLRVRADRDKLRQVLVNLLDNAIKYSSPGGKISIETKQEANAWELSIADQGSGIPADSIPRIFERFYRVDSARSREMGGTGLGLAIAKNIIEAHGGSIVCQSELDQGSRFTLTFPLK